MDLSFRVALRLNIGQLFTIYLPDQHVNRVKKRLHIPKLIPTRAVAHLATVAQTGIVDLDLNLS